MFARACLALKVWQKGPHLSNQPAMHNGTPLLEQAEAATGMSLCPFCLTSVQPHLQAAAYLHKIWMVLESQGLQVTTTVCIGDPAGEILQLTEQRGMNLIIINSH